MADIFISYAREDVESARRLAEALAGQGWSVWWDRQLAAGQHFERFIETQLKAARCIVVLWSRAAVESDWVQDEAAYARDRTRLVPARLEPVDPPFRFARLHTVDLADWRGEPAHAGFRRLVEDIAGLLAGPVKPGEGERRQAEEDAMRKAEEEQRRRSEAEARRQAEESQRAESQAKPPPRRTWIVVVVALVGAGAVAYGVLGPPAPRPAKAEPVAVEQKPPTPSAPGPAPAPTAAPPGETFKDCEVCPEMVVVPAGKFKMGSPEGEAERTSDEGPQHQVTVKPFAIGRYEVTFEEWDACVAGGGCDAYRPADAGGGRGRRPVIHVDWNDAQAYVAWLSKKTGKPYRLLTEAEWEYAARAGTTTPFHFGVTITPDQANYNGTSTYGSGPKGVYRRKTVPVGSFPANDFGLYDMHGNVWEWVEDVWHDSYNGAPADGSAWTDGEGLESSRYRVGRGGSWVNGPGFLRSADRLSYDPVIRGDYQGFRVARTLD
jgi:formylglycine-generating enzyme required for sulfatase activity